MVYRRTLRFRDSDEFRRRLSDGISTGTDPGCLQSGVYRLRPVIVHVVVY